MNLLPLWVDVANVIRQEIPRIKIRESIFSLFTVINSTYVEISPVSIQEKYQYIYFVKIYIIFLHSHQQCLL